MDQLFSFRWFAEVALYAAIMGAASTAVWAIPRWAEGRPRRIAPAQGRSAGRLLADAGIILVVQTAVIIAIRWFHGPLSSDTWAILTAFALTSVTQELLRTSSSG